MCLKVIEVKGERECERITQQVIGKGKEKKTW